MLPQINRIRKKKDFENIFAKSKVFRNKLLTLRVAKNNLQESRFGFVISKKISQSAAVRNKVRRRLGAIIHENIEKIKTGVDTLFITVPGIEKNNFPEIKKAVEDILNKADLL